MIPLIDLKQQQARIRPELDAAIAKVLDHGRYIMGPEVQELEEQLAAFAGTEHCIACSSGTDALLLPLMAWGIGPGDAVFTTPFTFFATVEVIALLGASPVFVDIDPDTYNIDPAKLAEAVRRIKQEGDLTARAIIPIDLFGLPADYDAIESIAKEHGLLILEDACQAFGSERGAKRAPGFGHAGATSFFPAKPLGCYGDGGAAFTDDEGLAATMRSIRVHGQGSDKYSNVRIGLNARMDTLQAAILIEKLRIYDEELDARQFVAQQYAEALKGISAVKLPVVPTGDRLAWAQFSILIDHSNEARAALKEEGIPTAVYYERPLHLLDAFAHLGHSQGSFPISESTSRRIVSLPFHPYIRPDVIDQVAKALTEVTNRGKSR